MLPCRIKNCKANLKNKNEYLKHIDSAHSVSGVSKNKYCCPFCTLVLGSRRIFYDHMKTSHKNYESEFPETTKSEEVYCRHCSQTFNSIEHFESHVKALKRGEKFPCPNCKIRNFTCYRTYQRDKSR